MRIRYIVGRAGVGKTHFILNEIKAELTQTDKKLILIVPEQFTLEAEKDLIEKLNLPGIINIEVLSFSRLAHYVFNEVGGLTRVHINEQGKNMVIRKIIGEVEKNLTIYKKTSLKPGFIMMFNELLKEFKQYDISPQDLKVKAEAIDKNSIIYNKIHDIAIIYEKFNQYLEGRYLDSEDYINLLITKMEETSFLKGSIIWIDGFHSYTAQTYRIIEKLSILTAKVTITLTMDLSAIAREDDLFQLTNNSFRKLQEIAAKFNVPEEIINLNEKISRYKKKSPEIIHLEQELFAYPYNTYSLPSENISLFSAGNPYTEIENVAIQIVTLAREKGYSWKDIAVVSNELNIYGPIIERVFSEYDIPYFLDQKRTIMHNPVIELILSVLEIISKGYRYEDIFKFFKTGFSGISIEKWEKLENYVLQYGIKGYKWREKFIYGTEEEITELEKIRKKFIEPLFQLEKNIIGNKTVEVITKSLFAYLLEIKLHIQLENWIEELKKAGRYEYVNENTQIWNITMEIFDQLVEIIGGQKVSLKEYIRILESGLLAIKIGIIPTTLDQVLIGSIQRSRNHDIKALFVVGVNDGIIPKIKFEENIISDEERIYFKAINLHLGSDSEKRAYEDKFMLYSLLSKPSEYLWISYALADKEGKALRPSVLISKFKHIFPELKQNTDISKAVEQQQNMVSTPNSTFKYLIEKLRLVVDGKPIESFWWEVYQWYVVNKEWDEKREAVIEGLFHKNKVDYMPQHYAKKIYGSPIRSSVSRLEQFIKCPFAHFIKYGLKPKERNVYKVEAPDIGEIFHNSLELFTKKLAENKLNWRDIDKVKSDELIDNVIDEIIPNYGNGIMLSTNRYKHLTNRLKRISKRAVWTLTDHLKRSGFEPFGHEVGFGLNQIFPPIEVELPDGEKIYIEGRIDRLDIYDDEGGDSYVKIIDYKSGNKDFRLSEVFYGLQLQLMVYLEAILNNKDVLKRKDLKPAGVFYFKIDDPLIDTNDRVVELIEKEIRKKLKMKGIALRDVNIIKEIDREIDGYSEIIPVGLSKKEEFYNNSSVIHSEEFSTLLKYVRKLIVEISTEITKGNIKIEPVKNGKQTACDVCQYIAVCQFDKSFPENNYNNIKLLADDEIISRLVRERGE